MSKVQKGKRFQHIIARMISIATGLPLEEIYSCHGGKKERDIQQSDRAKEVFPLHVECKNQRSLAPIARWIKQASDDAKLENLGLAPAVIFKIHGNTTPYIILELEDALTALYDLTPEQIQRLRNEQRGIRSDSE